MSKMNLQIKNFSEFEEVVRELTLSYEKMKDIFANQKANAEKVNETDIWTGEAQRAMYEKYNTLNGNYSPIEYSLDVYIKFLNKAKEDYRLMNEAIAKNADEFAESLDVNS